MTRARFLVLAVIGAGDGVEGGQGGGSVWTGTRADGGTGKTDCSVYTATCGSSLALYCFQVE